MRSKYNAKLAIIYACLTCILLNTTKPIVAQNSILSEVEQKYLLVATYLIPEPGKNWICRDYGLIQEKVSDKISYEKRRKEILQQYPGFGTSIRAIFPNQAIIAYEYEKKEAGWDCTKKVITINIGKDLESCKNEMEKNLAKWPKQYNSTPKIVFQRDATKFTSMSCKDMVRYRDTTLPKMIDVQTKKYKIQDEHIEYLKKLRTDLETETAQGTSNWNILPLTLKFAANSIEDAISMASPKGYLMKIAKQAGAEVVSKLEFYEWFNKGLDGFEVLASENYDEALANDALNKISALAPPVMLLKRLNENLTQQSDFMETRKEVKNQLSAIEKAMTDYNAKLEMSKKNLEIFKKYKEYINAYLIENCK
jgi:hypothetical protein